MYTRPVVLLMGSSDENLTVLIESCQYEYRIISETDAFSTDDLQQPIYSSMILLYGIPQVNDDTIANLKKICKRFGKYKTPVIAMTALENAEKVCCTGVQDVITTPLNITLAKRRLKSYAEKASMNLYISKQERYFETMMSETLFAYDFDIKYKTINLMYAAADSEHNYRTPTDYVMFSQHPELIHSHDYSAVVSTFDFDNLEREFNIGNRRLCLQFRILNRKGKWVWVEATVHLIRSNYDDSISGIGYVKVINERKRLEKKAEIDAVSTLFNRATAEEKIKTRLQSGYSNCAFFLYDIDNFKLVNDTFGHIEGDRLLHRISQVFRNNFTDSDIIGRIGGDEFVAFYTGASDRRTVIRKAEDTISEINRLSSEFGWDLDITVSLGVAEASNVRQNFETLYRSADKALYNAKAAGKNCYIICND